ncbi:enoyl-CoA hydratase/isomerase family protein [Parasphingorhabdus pacifica]
MTDKKTDPTEPVVVTRDGAVVTVTLNRPDRKNALNDTAWRGLQDALRGVRDDDAVRAVVITGAGGDFCSGADLSGERGDHPLDRMRWINDIATGLHDLPKPVIAKVRGVAVGAGWNLALGCDFVVAAEDARFSQIFAKRGLSLDFGGSWLLPRLVGMQQAKRLALLGDFVDAAEALSLGLATWVKPSDELDGFVEELADQLVAAPPVAVAQTKELLNEGIDQSFHEALQNEARAQVINFATEDTSNAFEAFRNKTTPVFTGKWAVS